MLRDFCHTFPFWKSNIKTDLKRFESNYTHREAVIIIFYSRFDMVDTNKYYKVHKKVSQWCESVANLKHVTAGEIPVVLK